LDHANEAKLEGNKLFVDGKYEEALSQYEVALQVAPDTPSSVDIRSICHSNRGVCFLKLVWPFFILLMHLLSHSYVMLFLTSTRWRIELNVFPLWLMHNGLAMVLDLSMFSFSEFRVNGWNCKKLVLFFYFILFLKKQN